jgi:hypothetical protein
VPQDAANAIVAAFDRYAVVGMSVIDARRAAIRTLGGADFHKGVARDTRRMAHIEDLIQRVCCGGRALRKSPGVTLSAVPMAALRAE